VRLESLPWGTSCDPAIRRRPADGLADDADLGKLPVTVAVGRLHEHAVMRAIAGLHPAA